MKEVFGNTKNVKMEITINHDLLNEIGINSQERILKFKENKRKASSLLMRLENHSSLKDFLKTNFNYNNQTSEKEFFYNLFTQNTLLSELIDIILFLSKNINQRLTKEIYEKAYLRRESDIAKILFESYLDPEKDILRKIHYQNYLGTQRYIESNRKAGNFPNIPNTISDSEIQTLLRECSQLKQRKKINVWYVLPTDQGLAIFIYVNARRSKVIPSTTKRRNQFIKYSKSNIIYLRNNGKKLLIYSRDIQRNIKYASAIFYESSSKDNPFELIFDIKEIESQKVEVENFISNLLTNRDEFFTLEDLSFYPDKSRYAGTLMSLKRENGSLTDILTFIKTIFPSAFNLSNLQEITFSHDGFQFTLNFWMNGEEIIVNYNYKARDPELGQKLVSYLKEKYRINLNKRTK